MALQGAQLRTQLQLGTSNHPVASFNASEMPANRSELALHKPNRPIFICASTREGEEELIIKAYLALPSQPFY